MLDVECYCDRCSGYGPTCEVGDHAWADNGVCKDCGDRCVGILLDAQWRKAERAGLACDDHFHRTTATKAACLTPIRFPVPDEEEDDRAR
jgi:hypothetical protein